MQTAPGNSERSFNQLVIFNLHICLQYAYVYIHIHNTYIQTQTAPGDRESCVSYYQFVMFDSSMCLHLCIFVHIHIYICIYLHTHTYIYIYIHTHISVYISGSPCGPVSLAPDAPHHRGSHRYRDTPAATHSHSNDSSAPHPTPTHPTPPYYPRHRSPPPVLPQHHSPHGYRSIDELTYSGNHIRPPFPSQARRRWQWHGGLGRLGRRRRCRQCPAPHPFIRKLKELF